MRLVCCYCDKPIKGNIRIYCNDECEKKDDERLKPLREWDKKHGKEFDTNEGYHRLKDERERILNECRSKK